LAINAAQGSHDILTPSQPLGRSQILALALLHNPTFEVFAANLAVARAELINALAYPNPEVEAGIGWSRPRGVEEGESDDTAREYGVSLSQPIEWPIQRRRRRHAAEAGLDVVDREREVYLVTLRAEVMRAIDTLLFEQRLLEVASENAEIASSFQELIAGRVEAGEAAEIDLVRARVDALQAMRAVQSQRRRIRTSEAVLDALTGGHLPLGFEVVDDLGEPVPPVNTPEILRRNGENHPSLRHLEALREQRERELASERVEWIPQPEPGVFLDRESDAKVLGATVGVQVPLWNRNQGGIAQAEAALARVDAEIARTRAEIRRDLLTAIQAYESALEQIAAFQGGLLEDAQSALETEQFLYEQGEVALLQVLDARRTAQLTRSQYLEALLDAATAREDLNEAIGIGGEE
jgi:cobalt-zinc-cadmium efflux system outer membrane protein